MFNIFVIELAHPRIHFIFVSFYNLSTRIIDRVFNILVISHFRLSISKLPGLSIEPLKMARSNVEEFLNQLGDGKFGNVVRAKGFIETDDGTVRIEYVLGRWDIHEFGSTAPRVEFIGTKLSESDIERSLRPR